GRGPGPGWRAGPRASRGFTSESAPGSSVLSRPRHRGVTCLTSRGGLEDDSRAETTAPPLLEEQRRWRKLSVSGAGAGPGDRGDPAGCADPACPWDPAAHPDRSVHLRGRHPGHLARAGPGRAGSAPVADTDLPAGPAAGPRSGPRPGPAAAPAAARAPAAGRTAGAGSARP